MPGKIRIDNHLDDIVQMTGEGMWAPQEHFSFYDMAATYIPEMPAYQPPIEPDWFNIPLALTPEPVMFEPAVQVQPEPEMVSYEPMSQELFSALMQQAVERGNAVNEDYISIRDIAEVNQIMIDHGAEPMSNGLSVVLPEALNEIDREIAIAGQGFFEIPQMIEPFGMGLIM